MLAHPDRGFLVFEVKSGEVQRDAHGRWQAGGRELRPSPFEQAKSSMHALVDKLAELPGASPEFHPIAVTSRDLGNGNPGGEVRAASLDL